MKKTLLFVGVILLSICANAQVHLTEDVNSLTVGNVGTDLTGTVPGQGDWLTTVVAGGTNSDFQVVDYGGNYGNVFQISGSNTNLTTGTRRLFKNVSSQWGFRDEGTNVAEVQFDFFTGPETNSANSMRVLLYDEPRTKVLAGVIIKMSTLVFSGLAYYDNAGVPGLYSFRLSYTATPTPGYSDLVLQRSTWYRLGFSYNYTTGEVIFKEATGLITSPPIVGASAGTEVAELNMIMTPISVVGEANSAAATGLYDNLVFKTSTTNTPLAVVSNSITSNEFSVYPNPANNILNVSSENNSSIEKVSFRDINGRVVKQSNYYQVSKINIDISDLQSGLYLMNIKSADGETIKKILKN